MKFNKAQGLACLALATQLNLFNSTCQVEAKSLLEQKPIHLAQLQSKENDGEDSGKSNKQADFNLQGNKNKRKLNHKRRIEERKNAQEEEEKKDLQWWNNTNNVGCNYNGDSDEPGQATDDTSSSSADDSDDSTSDTNGTVPGAGEECEGCICIDTGDYQICWDCENNTECSECTCVEDPENPGEYICVIRDDTGPGNGDCDCDDCNHCSDNNNCGCACGGNCGNQFGGLCIQLPSTGGTLHNTGCIYTDWDQTVEWIPADDDDDDESEPGEEESDDDGAGSGNNGGCGVSRGNYSDQYHWLFNEKTPTPSTDDDKKELDALAQIKDSDLLKIA